MHTKLHTLPLSHAQYTSNWTHITSLTCTLNSKLDTHYLSLMHTILQVRHTLPLSHAQYTSNWTHITSLTCTLNSKLDTHYLSLMHTILQVRHTLPLSHAHYTSCYTHTNSHILFSHTHTSFSFTFTLTLYRQTGAILSLHGLPTHTPPSVCQPQIYQLLRQTQVWRLAQ